MPASRAGQAKADRLGPAGQRSSTHGAWLARLQAEIAELIAERGALVESVTAGRDGLLVQPQAGQGALLRQQHSGTMSTWIGLDERSVYYYEHVWHRQRRWQTTRTPEW